MKSTENKFEHLGYFKEYYINNKFIGTLKCEKDREVIGYFGRIKEIPKDNITLENMRVIKKGQLVYTILYPICGKIIAKVNNLLPNKE